MSTIAGATDRFRMDGRVAVVTGASGGLGAHFAATLHAAGATVALLARRADRLEALASELDGAVAVPCDLSDPSAREEAMEEVRRRAGPVDVLVNNAGIGVVKPVEDETLDDFASVVELNLTAVWHMTKMAGVDMVARGSGSVVNIGSILGLVGSSPLHQAGYSATKGAITNLTRELALQWGPRGVRVNTLAPGWFPSELTAGMEDERSQRFISRGAALGRMGRLEELDGPLLLLASDAGAYITGATIVVDGGWTAR